MLTKRDLRLWTDADRRAEAYRRKLVETLNKRPNIPAEEALDRLSQAYALVGNLQMYLNDARADLILREKDGVLPE